MTVEEIRIKAMELAIQKSNKNESMTNTLAYAKAIEGFLART